jgi:hypothetical protein
MSEQGGELALWERCRLWLSYQRYFFLLVGLAAAIPVAIVLYDPGAWYLWLLGAFPVFKLLHFAVEVYRRWPEKIRATKLADRRIASGQFTPKFVENYCGDPCFRVVARELLSRAGLPSGERRRIIRELTKQAKAASDVVLMVDHRSGVELRVGGEIVESHSKG